MYVPGSEDEQFDVVCLPLSDMNEFNLEQLFAHASESDSSMELDEAEANPDIDTDIELAPDTPQTQPPQPDSDQTDHQVFNPGHSQATAQSRVILRPGPFNPKVRSSSSSNVPAKRIATSPRASEPPKVPTVSQKKNSSTEKSKTPQRKSTRSKSEVDYFRVQHRYDDIIDN